MNAAVLEEVNAALASLAPRLDPEPMDQWLRRMVMVGGSRSGQPLDTRDHAAQTEYIRAYMSGRWSDLVVVGPTQDGKTVVCIMVPLLYTLLELRQSAVYGLPDELAAARQFREKFLPIFEASGWMARLPEVGQGSKQGSRVTVHQFADGGLLTWMGAGGKNESAQSSITAPLVVVDEVDSLKAGMLEKMERRTDAYGLRGRRVKTSTIKRDDGTSTILRELSKSTDMRCWFACPHCGRFQPLEWEQVSYDGADEVTAFDSAAFACVHCAGMWTDADRLQALKQHRLVARGQMVDEAGAIVGEPPRTRSWGIRWTALDSPFRHLGQLCALHYRAALDVERGDHAPMRQFFRDQLCRIYLGDLQLEDDPGQQVSTTGLAKRSAAHGWCEVVPDLHDEGLWSRYEAERAPDGLAGLVVAVDVQQDRLYWCLVGYRQDSTSYDLAWGQERSRMKARQDGDRVVREPEPWGPGDLHATLDRVKEHVALLSGIYALSIKHAVVDTGYEGRELSTWLARNRGWRGIKGHDVLPRGQYHQRALPDLVAYNMQWMPGLGRWDVVTEAARARVHAAYVISATDPGAALLPKGLQQAHHYLRHLCSWQLVTDEKTKRTKWVRKQKRDDHLDTRTYAQAMILIETQRRQPAPTPKAD